MVVNGYLKSIGLGVNMNNEPVAIRYDFDGYGYQYIDSGSGSDWLTRVDGELLYTQPNEHDLGIAEAIGFDKGYKAATANIIAEILEKNNPEIEKANAYIKSLEDEIEALKAKTLTDEEIKQIFQEQTGFFFDDNPADDLALMDFARAILRKAQEK
jgi:hypothetical protein